MATIRSTALFLVSVSLIGISHAAQPFEYERVILCGPERLPKHITPDTRLDGWKFFYINFDSKNRFVVQTGGHQYPSFRKIQYEQLFAQNGGTYYASRKDNDHSYVFLLYSGSNNWLKKINIEKPYSDRFKSQVKKDGKWAKPIHGYCWNPSQ